MKNKAIILLVVLAFSFTFFGNSVFADTTTGTGYSVTPVFSEHQTDGIDNFFDIRWTPGATDTFSLKITNNSDTEQTYIIKVNKARTNRNGIIDYSDDSPEFESAKYKLTEMVILPAEVTVAANSSQEIHGELVFPDNDFDGLLMAGIYVSEKNGTNSEATVSNTIAYSIPFVVRGNIDERPTPNIELIDLSVEKFSSDTYAVNAELNNVGPNLLKEVKFEARIENESGEVIDTQESTIDITPETSFIYPIKLNSTYKSGQYKLVLSLKHGEENSWEFIEEFEISSDDSKEIKELSKSEGNHFIWYGMGVGVVVILSIWIFIAKKKSKKQDQS